MPNWTYNKITCKKSIGDKILTKDKDTILFDFNKLIPMPDSLNLTSGSIEDRAVASYYLSLDKKDRRSLEDLLDRKQVFFDGSYWNRYKTQVKYYEDNPDKFKEDNDSFDGKISECDKKFLNLSSLGKQYIENIKNYGCSQWYDWCSKNWGTKWNVMDEVSVDYDEIEEEYSIVFNTAWCPPYGIIEEYSKLCNPDEFNWEYENEDYDGHHHLTKDSSGKIIDTVIEDYENEDEEMEI